MTPDRKNFSQPEEPGLERSMARLAAACERLIFVSETDAPVEPVTIPPRVELSPTGLLEFLDRGEVGPVEKVDAAEFFGRLAEPREWHSGTEKEIARRFGLLRKVLENELEDLRVYRIGKVRVDIFVLGRTRGGTIAGVHTRAVET